MQKKTVSIPGLSPSVSSYLQETLELVVRPSGSCRRKNRPNYRTSQRLEEPCKEEAEPETAEEPAVPAEAETDLKTEISEEPQLPPPPKVPDKTKAKATASKRRKVAEKAPEPSPAVSVPVVDSTTAEEPAKVVSLKPREEQSVASTGAALPEEVPLVPVCPPTEELLPVQSGGILVDSTKLIAPVKTDMILSSPVKLVASQYIEQPFVQTVMPVQMPVAYQIPIVKLSPPSGVFLPQIPNYIIPPSPPAVFPTSPVSTFRNGFQLSATGTIQIQTSSTTLQQTGSNFVQSTNSSGFQIVQSPVALPQSIITAFQNSGMSGVGLKSPTLRLLNCQPLILNKPIGGNVSMTVTNVTAARTEQSNVAVQAVAEPSKSARKVASSSPGSKKLVKQKLTILPKPNISPKTTTTTPGGDGGKSQKQCLQTCGPTSRAAAT